MRSAAIVRGNGIAMELTTIGEPFHTLLSAAILAPSGDNTQPWKFEIDEAASSITVLVDETRDTSPMNAEQRMARIACGAAIENILRTAQFNDWQTSVEWHGSPVKLATIAVTGDFSKAGQVEQVVKDRHTNRHRYDGREVTEETLARLRRELVEIPGTALTLVVSRDEIAQWAAAIGQADAAMFGQPEFLRAFLDNVRFDLPSNTECDEGLALGSLGLSTIDQALLPVIRHSPAWLIRSRLFRWPFSDKARRLALSSSGLAIVDANHQSPAGDVAVGRMMERVWLALAGLGLSTQPMMSISVLNHAGQFKEVGSNSEILSRTSWFQSDLPSAVLRFGHTARAPIRTGRRRSLLAR
jgi:hypothetical protein